MTYRERRAAKADRLRAYETQNIGGNLSRLRARLAMLTRAQKDQ